MQKRQNKHPDPTPWLFLAPSLCGVTLFVLAPFVETVRRSVTDTMGRHFVGLANYTAVLGNDAFRLAVENTVRFIGVCVPLLLALSLALALALRAKGLKNTSWAEVCRTTFLLPMALPVASLALLWKVLFAQNGLVNGTFGTHCDFMGTDAAFWVLVGTYLWKNIGYDSILWSSGLDSISTDLYEAAAVDGASGWRQFTAITLPNLLPTLAVTLVLSLLNTFKVSAKPIWWPGPTRKKASIYCSICSTTGSWHWICQAERRSNPDGRGAGGGDRGMHKTALKKILLFPFVLLVWFPLWFLLMGTLTGSEELAATIGPALSGSGQAAWTLLPSYPTLEPAVKLLLDTPEYFTTYWNTCLQTFPQLAGQLVVGAPAAWALSRLKFRGRGAVRGLYLILMLLPFQVTMVPAYLTINHLGLMDTVWAVILPGAFSTFPVFVMQRGFDAVPLPLLEAAAIDGATPWQQFARIGLPVGLPGILAALTMSFLDAWNALEQPMTFLKTQSLWSLSLYLTDTTATWH